MRYDPDNIFAKIIRNEIPCHKIYEDAYTLAFMDVMPQVEGHCLVVPKTGSRSLLDANPDVVVKVMATVQKVASAAMKAVGADGVQIRQYNEAAAGQTVFHLHFHILPMKAGTDLKHHSGALAEPVGLERQAEQIRLALP